MLQQNRKGFYKRTRKGKVIKVVQENYFRNDLECGYRFGKLVSSGELRSIVSLALHKQILIIDTNIAVHQIDVLEYNFPAISIFVVCQTVLQELRHINLSVFRRTLALLKDESKNFFFYPNEFSSETAINRDSGESINDFNDRAIVTTAMHYKQLIASFGEVLFISNDAANQKRSIISGIESLSMKSYVEKFLLNYPELLDLLSINGNDNNNLLNDKLNTKYYPEEYLTSSEILSGLKVKKYLKGTIRCKRDAPYDCYVLVHSSNVEQRKCVLVQGCLRVNRAIDGDIVAVELLENAGNPEEKNEEDLNRSKTINDESIVGVHDMNLEATTEALEGFDNTTSSDVTNQIKVSATGSHALHGKVVGIVRRDARQYAGSLDLSSIRSATSEGDTLVENNKSMETLETEDSPVLDVSTSVLFVPVDKKFPRVWITTRRIDMLADCRIVVAIDYWPTNSKYPFGHFIRIIGKDGDKKVETEVLLHEFQVPNDDFSSAVMACLPPPDWKITNDIIAQRTDLRMLPVVSIDPPGCKDIDDALHCVRLPNGRIQAGVHIADPDSPLDKEAAHRSTSTYLVERRLDMLPGFLTTQLCSLRSKEDHLAFSVIWEMDDNANILDVQFCKSVIHSVASLTYDEAQIMLDDRTNGNDAVIQSVKLLNKLAHILRTRRIDAGALTLASPEVRFKLDLENQNPTDVSMYQLKESNALVEEWMLLANITVSKQTLRYYPTLSILRRHQPPSREQFAPLLLAASAVGVFLNISSSKTLADSLDAAERPEDPYFNKLLRILSTRCMMPAQYFCSGEIPKEQWHHYGLASPVYTHFTSPIRRYADILVHRLLAASINVISLPVENSDRSKQRELCSHMNRRHKAAQHVQRASVNLHTLVYFKSKPSIEQAYVLSITTESFSVIVPRFGIEGSILWEEVSKALSSDQLVFDVVGHKMRIYSPKNKPLLSNPNASSKKKNNEVKSSSVLLELKVFDKVQISIKVVGSSSGGDRRLSIGLVHNGVDLSA